MENALLASGMFFWFRWWPELCPDVFAMTKTPLKIGFFLAFVFMAWQTTKKKLLALMILGLLSIDMLVTVNSYHRFHARVYPDSKFSFKHVFMEAIFNKNPCPIPAPEANYDPRIHTNYGIAREDCAQWYADREAKDFKVEEFKEKLKKNLISM